MRDPRSCPIWSEPVGATLAAYTERAAKDWENILLGRARELVPGGRLVFMNFGKDEQGRYLGGTGGIDMFDHVRCALEGAGQRR